MTFSTESQRRLIWHGMFLFLLGLLIGFAEGQVINPRMGRSRSPWGRCGSL
jgi:(hydroxyamino)benzene mutase